MVSPGAIGLGDTSVKILLVSDFYPPLVGGLETHVHDLALALHRRGHEVIVATSPSTRPSDDVVQVLRLSHSLNRFGFLYSDRDRRFYPPWPDHSLRANLRDVIKKFGVELVHSHGWITFNAIAAGQGSAMRLPVVATLHDYGFVCPKMSLLKKGAEICLKRRADFGCISCASESYGPIKSVVVTAAMRNFASIIKRASALIAVSHHVARVAEESGLAEVQVIPPFIDLENVRSMAQDNAHRFTWVDILYGGGNKPWKGFQIFADSMRKIKDAGSSLTFDVGDLKSTKRGGALPREEYLGRLAKSRILVVPSISPEAFGLAAVEGMALGRAVIASDIGGLSEIIEDQRSGLLIPPGRSDALAQSILRLGNDPQLCDRLGKQAQEVADIKFGAVNTLQPLEKLYESVVQ